MWGSILGIGFVVIIGLGILSILLLHIFKLIEYIIDFKRFLERKLIKVKKIANLNVEKHLNDIDPSLYLTLLEYFKGFNSARKYSRDATFSFIKEVYYATFQLPIKEIKQKEMIAALNEHEKETLPLISYELQSIQQPPGKDRVTILVDQHISFAQKLTALTKSLM